MKNKKIQHNQPPKDMKTLTQSATKRYENSILIWQRKIFGAPTFNYKWYAHKCGSDYQPKTNTPAFPLNS